MFLTGDCNDARLCGVTGLADGHPILAVCCYMPYWDPSGSNTDEYSDVTGKLSAILSSLWPCAQVALLGDLNCGLCPLPRESRPPAWHRLREYTPNSMAMQGLLDDHELTVVEFNFTQSVSFTYSRAGNRSHTDHIAVPQVIMPQVLGCTILPLDLNKLSPHLLLICKLAVSVPSGTNHSVSQDVGSNSTHILDWSFPERNEYYKTVLSDLLSEVLSTCDGSPDALDTAISRCAHDAARIAGCANHAGRLSQLNSTVYW